MARLFRRLRDNNRSNEPSASIQPPSAPSLSTHQTTLTCHTCHNPIPRNERHIQTSRPLSGDRRYHRDCFICYHCKGCIDPVGRSFCYARIKRKKKRGANIADAGIGGGNNRDNTIGGDNYNSNDGAAAAGGIEREEDKEQPFHKECFARYFGWMCVVCEQPLPMVTKVKNDGSIATNDADGTDGGGGRNEDGNNDSGGFQPDANDGDNNASSSADQGGEGKRKSTRVEFLKHPFFDNEKMCPHHAGPITVDQLSRQFPQNRRRDGVGVGDGGGEDEEEDEYDTGRGSINTTTSEEVIGEIRRCAGCHRFEPLFANPSKHFIDVGDANTGRCVCLACCRTVVTNSNDAVPLWERVIDFFDGLGLITPSDEGGYGGGGGVKTGVTRRDLKSIPILIVGMEALNDNMKRHSSHFGSSQIMTRGLCLSERTGSGSGAGGHGGCSDGIGVTAILCLSGLPSDLTASILAHGKFCLWVEEIANAILSSYI